MTQFDPDAPPEILTSKHGVTACCFDNGDAMRPANIALDNLPMRWFAAAQDLPDCAQNSPAAQAMREALALFIHADR
jgi:hypothetical protein